MQLHIHLRTGRLLNIQVLEAETRKQACMSFQMQEKKKKKSFPLKQHVEEKWHDF